MMKYTKVTFVRYVKLSNGNMLSFNNPVSIDGGFLCENKFVPWSNVQFCDYENVPNVSKKKQAH